MHGILKLRKMIQEDPDMGWREGYGARGTEEVVASDEETDSAINVFVPRSNTAGA
jgi:hypothetical protein